MTNDNSQISNDKCSATSSRNSILVRPQCFNRIEPGGAPRGHYSGNDPDATRNSYGDDDGRQRKVGRKKDCCYDPARKPCKNYPDRASDRRKHDRFDQELLEDVISARTEALAN